MRWKITEEDKQRVRAISRNKGTDLGFSLLENGVRGDVFDYVMQGSADVKYENHRARQEWLAGAMERMDERLPKDEVKRIRESGACCLGGERAQIAKRIHDENATLDARFEALANARFIIGDTAKKVEENVYRICFWENPTGPNRCACLKHIPKDKPMSKSWCACCGGHIKAHFENALGVKAECECVSSQLSSCGKEPCVFELRVVESEE